MRVINQCETATISIDDLGGFEIETKEIKWDIKFENKDGSGLTTTEKTNVDSEMASIISQYDSQGNIKIDKVTTEKFGEGKKGEFTVSATGFSSDGT